MDSSREASIGVAWGSPGGTVADIGIAIEDITGVRPKSRRLADLAGPNETIQILLDPANWQLIAAAALGVFGSTIVSEVAKATWRSSVGLIKNTPEILSAFQRLCSAIRLAPLSKSPVVLGLARAPFSRDDRNIGIELSELTPEEIGRVACLLAEHASDINAVLDTLESVHGPHPRFLVGRNSDGSCKIFAPEGGRFLQLRVRVDGASEQVYTFPPTEPHDT